MSERGLVERVAREIAVRQTAKGFKTEVLEQDLISARAIIEEVADALEEGIDDRGLRPTTADMWRSASEWLRSQAREDSDE